MTHFAIFPRDKQILVRLSQHFISDKFDLLPLADDLNLCPIRGVSLNYATKGKWYLPSVRRGYFIRDRDMASLTDRVQHSKRHLCCYIHHL